MISDARASSDNSASAGSYAPGRPSENVQTLRAESPVSEWSENWLAYTPFDAVMISAADMNALTPGVSGALADYLFAGGNIFVAGKKQLPAAWHTLTQTPSPASPNSISLSSLSANSSGNSAAAISFLPYRCKPQTAHSKASIE